MEKQTAAGQFRELLEALDELKDYLLIFTKPNSDKDGRIIIKMIDEYVNANSHKAIAFTSLGQLRYLSAIQFVDAVIGNSSSGIIEVPAFNVPTVNIGDRQKGRIIGTSIICCDPQKNDIRIAINTALLYDKDAPKDNPYGDGHTTEKILKILKEKKTISLKKSFYDIKI